MKVSEISLEAKYIRARGNKERCAALDDALLSFRAEATTIFRRAGISECCPCCHREEFVVFEAPTRMDCYARQCARCTYMQQFRQEKNVEWQKELVAAQKRFLDAARRINK